MNQPHRTAFKSLPYILALCLGLTACRGADQPSPPPIVGTWLVSMPEAPFPLHMFTFHADGTVLQSNPDAGDVGSSDSNAMGVWVVDRTEVKGKVVELTADRSTHHFESRGEISFVLAVNGNALSGTANAVFYDASGQQIRGPIRATMKGQRVLP